MNVGKVSKLQTTRAAVTGIGVLLIALLFMLMYWQTTQAAAMPVTVKQATQSDDRATRTPEAEKTPSATVTPGDDGQHGGGDDQGHAGVLAHGRIVSLPAAGLLGTWVISSTKSNDASTVITTTFLVTKTTRLEQRFGKLALGACVQTVLNRTTTPPTAFNVATTRDFICASDDDHHDDHPGDHPTPTPGLAHGTLFGVIQSFPTTTLTGTWQIGGMSFVADSRTKFDQKRVAFAISVTVQVDFYVDVDGVNHAIEISTRFANDDHHHGGDDNGGHHDGAKGQAFGTLGSFPSGLVGVWVIGGIEYTATNKTEFQPKHGAFATGVMVKVEYFLDANNQRIAREIETSASNGGSIGQDDAVLFGFVQVKPTDGFTGTWVVGDITFTTDLSTTFNEKHGLLAVGTFVKVEYTATGGNLVIKNIETEVPPGCGDHDHVGKIERIDNTDLAAASVTANTQWQIGGKTYTVTPATILNDAASALAVNQTAVVNSYTAADGTEVATQIQGIAVNAQVFLPAIQR